MPKDWEIEFSKPDLEDFTLGEYTEKVILYGFLMVMNFGSFASLGLLVYISYYYKTSTKHSLLPQNVEFMLGRIWILYRLCDIFLYYD